MNNPDIPPPREPLLVDEVTARRRHVQTWPEARAKLVMTIAMWGASHAIFTLGNWLAGMPDFVSRSAVRGVIELLGVAFCFVLHCLLRSLAHLSFRTRALVLGVAGMVAGETYAWGVYFGGSWFRGKPAHFVIVDWNDAAVTFSLWTWFFMAWTGLYLAIEYAFDAREEARRAAELRTLAHTAKLRALSSQISPHFLFNSLNSISALILDGKADAAERMLTGLATFFRSSLAIDPLYDITVEREFDLHRRYLAIEQMRYPDLTVEFELPEDLRAAALPALILQPLVENAIKHGVAKSPPPTLIRVAAERAGNELALHVVNRGRSSAPQRTSRADGIGIANVRERLAEYYGEAQTMTVTASDDGFAIRIAIPLSVAQ